jgi:uncharacterized membrane protein YqjE
MESPSESPPGLLASIQRLGRTVVAVAHNRIELLLVEAEEERLRALRAVLLLVFGAVFGLLALVFGSLTLVMLAGPEHRLAAVLTLFAAYSAATVLTFWSLRRHMRGWQSFAATLKEMRKDREWLRPKE